MKIPISYDVVGKEPPSYNKGTDSANNPQIEPYEKAIPQTPGEKAVNSTEPDTMSKGQPFKNKGGGYC